VKKAVVGQNVFLETEGKKRRVIVRALVVLREGPLEGLLTRARAKEHEYILAADTDARDIHRALLAAGAEPGSPVQFHPKFRSPSGTTIKVSLRYKRGGQVVTVPAQKWIRHYRTKKDLDRDWVFAGSRFNEQGGGPTYLANYGDLICVVNIESAMLDLPIKSPKTLDDRVYEAHTERIPPKETPVDVILEPVR
jgi:hypothetical protein